MPKNSSLLIDIGQGIMMTLGFPTLILWNTDSRPKNPRRGTFGFNTETSSLEFFDGSSWFTGSMSQLQSQEYS